MNIDTAINILYTTSPIGEDIQEAHRMAIEALNKARAKSYVVKRLHAKEDTGFYYSYHCPTCGENLGNSYWNTEPIESWEEYCEHCGQHIDWQHDVDYSALDPEEK